MPNTTTYEFGDIVLVPFPFTDQSATKKRPAVVVSSEVYHRQRPDVIVMALTSQFRLEQTIGDVVVEHWQSAGLLKPSVLKPLLATIERSLVLRIMGKLHPEDRSTLRNSLDQIIGR
jgi:mRNA interferase MazF